MITDRTPSVASLTSIVAALVALAMGPGVLSAQGTLHGRVVDSETGLPVIGARVVIRKDAPLTTDSSGLFIAPNMAAGDASVTITMLGYLPGQFKIHLNDGGVQEKTFSLDFTGQKLPQVVVQARAEQIMGRYAEFEARRQRGAGAFLRWDQLTNEKYGSVGDALRSIRGVRMQCNQQTFECYAVMARSPQCKPVWIIDGMEAAMFNENTPIRDVYGIEVYRGPGEIPGEYTGSNAACGVIVLHTKSRPFRSSNP